MPVLLVTGDRATCAEATELLGAGLTTVEVKVGLGRFSARTKTPQRARELIEAGARAALADLSAVAPYDPGRPCEIEIDFATPDRLQEYANRKGVEVTGPRTLVVRGRRLVERLVGVLLLVAVEARVVRISVAPVKALALVHPDEVELDGRAGSPATGASGCRTPTAGSSTARRTRS